MYSTGLSLIRGGNRALMQMSQMRSFSAAMKYHDYPSEYPEPPPAEFLPDGSPKRYTLNQPLFEHRYNYKFWRNIPAGIFHTVQNVTFSRDYPTHLAQIGAYPLWITVPTLFALATLGGIVFYGAQHVGLKPKRFTVEWMEAMKERERAENTNAVTRYLDRRYAERGPSFILGQYLPWHNCWLWTRDIHDLDLVDIMAEKRENMQKVKEFEETHRKRIEEALASDSL